MALGDLEREVMTQLWDAGEPLTVRQVHERVSRERDLAYTTVMTVLDRLAKKGVVTQEKADRAYRYAPAQSREEMTAALMLDALSGAPDGATRDAALAHFVGRLSPEALRRRDRSGRRRAGDRAAARRARADPVARRARHPGRRPLAGPGPGRRGACSGRRSPWPACSARSAWCSPPRRSWSARPAPAGRSATAALVGALVVAAVIVDPAAGVAGRGQLPVPRPPRPAPHCWWTCSTGPSAHGGPATCDGPAGARRRRCRSPTACRAGRRGWCSAGGALDVLDDAAGRRGARARAGAPAAPARAW